MYTRLNKTEWRTDFQIQEAAQKVLETALER